MFRLVLIVCIVLLFSNYARSDHMVIDCLNHGNDNKFLSEHFNIFLYDTVKEDNKFIVIMDKKGTYTLYPRISCTYSKNCDYDVFLGHFKEYEIVFYMNQYILFNNIGVKQANNTDYTKITINQTNCKYAKLKEK